MGLETEKKDQNTHKISLHARKSMTVEGVTDVVSFDDGEVVLETVCGGMTVEGASLHIHVLNVEAGTVAMEGKIDQISYYDNEPKPEGGRGLFGKLLR